MTNDIRKNIMLIENIILDESFKDAQRKFSSSTSSEEVKSYIDKFKELSKRNIIKGQDKDIGTWIKGDWVDFKKFVDSNSAVVTKSQSKAVQKKDSIVVYKDEDKQVVIPLTKEASIHYGKNTKWCTSASESKNYFTTYFYIKGITLFYVLFKNGNKYACAFHPEQADTIECFDQYDRNISFGEFSKVAGVSVSEIRKWYSGNKGVIMKAQDINKLDEEAQIELVKQSGYAIKYIVDNGIVPSEEVQLAAVKRNAYVIDYIIKIGIEPSEAVQLATVQRNGLVIEVIDNPSETVQLAAVQQNGHAIEYIIDGGITPSEEVQLAAVKQNGLAIGHIDNPSENLQLAAVQQNGHAISRIKNPSEKVKALHKKLYG